MSAAKRQMSQVLGMRPNAKMLKGGAGYIVVDGQEELSDTSGGYVGTADQAWAHAFHYLMRRFRQNGGAA